MFTVVASSSGTTRRSTSTLTNSTREVVMSSAQPTGQEGPRQVFARLMAAVLAYDMDAQADLYAVDGILEWPFAPPGMPRHVEGREAIRGLLVPLGERAKQSGRRLREYDAVVIHETTDPEVIIVEFDVTGE